jgi:hypothetical protein
MRYWKKIVKIFTIFLLAIFLLLGLFYFVAPRVRHIDWGVSFSPDYAAYLGFDKKQLYLDVLDDLRPKYLRLIAYWEDLEYNRGDFNLPSTDFTFMLKEAEKRDVKVLLVLGHKQPRWPECHHPAWYEKLSQDEKDQAVLHMLQVAINYFKNFKAVEMWQIENEPYFVYGPDCPVIAKDFYQKEVALVKSLDNRPIVVTDSGEKGAWLPTAYSGGDVFGSTLYRTVYQDKQKRYLTYPLPPMFYRLRAGMNRLLSPISRIIGVELQAEPWFNGTVYSTSWKEQNRLMNPQIFYANINYAKQTGLERQYFWGTEWWAWAKKQGHPEMWEAAKQFFNNNK